MLHVKRAMLHFSFTRSTWGKQNRITKIKDKQPKQHSCTWFRSCTEGFIHRCCTTETNSSQYWNHFCLKLLSSEQLHRAESYLADRWVWLAHIQHLTISLSTPVRWKYHLLSNWTVKVGVSTFSITLKRITVFLWQYINENKEINNTNRVETVSIWLSCKHCAAEIRLFFKCCPPMLYTRPYRHAHFPQKEQGSRNQDTVRLYYLAAQLHLVAH